MVPAFLPTIVFFEENITFLKLLAFVFYFSFSMMGGKGPFVNWINLDVYMVRSQESLVVNSFYYLLLVFHAVNACILLYKGLHVKKILINL